MRLHTETCIYIEKLLHTQALTHRTVYILVCARHFPILLLCTAKLAQSTSQYYFVLQSLQKVLPSTTLYYKACTKHVSVLLCTTKLAQGTSQYLCITKLEPPLLCTTKLAQSTSQYYSLYYNACTKHVPVPLCITPLRTTTTLYNKACTKHVPVLLCTTNTTLYNKACTKHFPVLLCTTKLARGTSQYYFVLQSLHKVLAITMRHRYIDLQNTLDLRATA